MSTIEKINGWSTLIVGGNDNNDIPKPKHIKKIVIIDRIVIINRCSKFTICIKPLYICWIKFKIQTYIKIENYIKIQIVFYRNIYVLGVCVIENMFFHGDKQLRSPYNVMTYLYWFILLTFDHADIWFIEIWIQ